MPAIVDRDGPGGKPMSMFESGAILFYLASKTGKFLPEDVRNRWTVMQWVMFQMGHIGPMLGQAHHFLGYSEQKIEYAINRYRNEANRLYGVLDRRLKEVPYVAGKEYTIADMAIMPWLRSYRAAGREHRRVPERPALVRQSQRAPGGEARPAGARRPPPHDPAHAGAARGDVRGAAVRATLRRGRWRR